MDWLDVEMFRDQKVVSEIVQKAHQKKVLVVMSNHDSKHQAKMKLKTLVKTRSNGRRCSQNCCNA